MIHSKRSTLANHRAAVMRYLASSTFDFKPQSSSSFSKVPSASKKHHQKMHHQKGALVFKVEHLTLESVPLRRRRTAGLFTTDTAKAELFIPAQMFL